jgi:phosphoenolpyruvate carboxylase
VTVLGYSGKIGKKIVKEIKEGKRQFTPDREKDLLTLVLGNDKHRGRTRGFGPSYPWWLGFAKDQETYRSRARAKKRQQDEENDKFNQLLARLKEQQQQIDKLRGVVRQQDPALDITAGPSKRKRSVAESEAPTDDARRMIEGSPGYPWMESRSQHHVNSIRE